MLAIILYICIFSSTSFPFLKKSSNKIEIYDCIVVSFSTLNCVNLCLNLNIFPQQNIKECLGELERSFKIWQISISNNMFNKAVSCVLLKIKTQSTLMNDGNQSLWNSVCTYIRNHVVGWLIRFHNYYSLSAGYWLRTFGMKC